MSNDGYRPVDVPLELKAQLVYQKRAQLAVERYGRELDILALKSTGAQDKLTHQAIDVAETSIVTIEAADRALAEVEATISAQLPDPPVSRSPDASQP